MYNYILNAQGLSVLGKMTNIIIIRRNAHALCRVVSCVCVPNLSFARRMKQIRLCCRVFHIISQFEYKVRTSYELLAGRIRMNIEHPYLSQSDMNLALLQFSVEFSYFVLHLNFEWKTKTQQNDKQMKQRLEYKENVPFINNNN